MLPQFHLGLRLVSGTACWTPRQLSDLKSATIRTTLIAAFYHYPDELLLPELLEELLPELPALDELPELGDLEGAIRQTQLDDVPVGF